MDNNAYYDYKNQKEKSFFLPQEMFYGKSMVDIFLNNADKMRTTMRGVDSHDSEY